MRLRGATDRDVVVGGGRRRRGDHDGLELAGVDVDVGARRLGRRPGRDDVELLGGIGRIEALEHVDDDHGDVVVATALVGDADELVGGALWILGLDQHAGDVVVDHLVDEAVAAQHVPVATDDRQRPRVDTHRRLDPQRAGDDVATRMVAGLVAVDVSLGDELLHVAVVDRELAQLAVADQVGA